MNSSSIHRLKSTRYPLLPMALMACLLVLFVLAIASYRGVPYSDSIDYLEQSFWMQEHGVFGFLKASFSGQYSFEGKHPGLPLLLSPFGGRSLSGIVPMRWANHAVLMVVLLSSIWAIQRKLGGGWALAWLVMILGTHAWIKHAQVIMAEPLFFALYFLCWLAAIGHLRFAVRWHWFFVGLLVGLSYFIKGTAVLFLLALPISWVAYVMWSKVRPFKRSAFWDKNRFSVSRSMAGLAGLFFLGVLAGGAPVFVNNVLKHGSPLYSDQSVFMWMDHWSQFDDYMAGRIKPSFERYWEAHGSMGFVSRTGSGLFYFLRQVPYFFHSNLPFSEVLSIGLFLSSGWGWWTLRDPFARIFTACLLLLTFGLFAFYLPIIENTLRHVVIVNTVLAYLSLLGIRNVWIRYRKVRRRAPAPRSPAFRSWIGRAVSILIFCVGVWSLVGWIKPALLRPASEPISVRPGYLELARWMEAELVRKDQASFQTAWLGPKNQVTWMLPKGPRLYNIPKLENMDALNELAAQLNIRYMILDFNNWQPRREIFLPYFEASSPRIPQRLPGWRLVFTDRTRPVHYVIYQKI